MRHPRIQHNGLFCHAFLQNYPSIIHAQRKQAFVGSALYVHFQNPVHLAAAFVDVRAGNFDLMLVVKILPRP